MSEKHFKEELSAFFNHELSPVDRQSVGEHLLHCRDCRQEHEEIKFGSDLAQNLNRASAPDSLWDKIDAEFDKKEDARTLPFYFVTKRTAAFASFIFVAMLAAGTLVYVLLSDSGPIISGDDRVNSRPIPPGGNSASWQVETIAGSPKIANSANGLSLEVGGVLETDANSSARIDVADIGQVEIAPNSLVKFVNSSETEHRLALERGALEARISAPPRLFVVDTPTAAAVDLGCAYRLEVDDDGNSKLVVTSGYVSLEREGRESMVPAGAVCLTRHGKGLGTPFLETSSTALKKALFRFDFENGGSSALSVILKEARAADTLTLWHLLSRVPEADRKEVYARSAALVRLPKDVRREGIMRLDPAMMERWRGEMELSWYEY